MAVNFCTVLASVCLLCAVMVEGNDEDRDYRDFYEYDDDDNGIKKAEKCPDINLPRGLGGPCKVSDFCSNITCEVKVGEKSATLIFKINQCDDPITATVTVKIQGYAVDWSHTFKDGEKIKLPVGKESGVMAQGSVSLLVVLKREGKKLHFKLQLLGKVEVPLYHKLDGPIDKTLIDGKISLSDKHCGFSAWFNKQPRYIKILVIAGPILVFILLLVLTVYCRMRCKHRAPTRLHVEMPSHRARTTTTRSKVPMQRLINQE
ncbi:hypothetical protein pdam_00003434 [Pocillopora damicornis]|uniref:Integrin alpha-2 domain-containing protein n=1 Tax=Pocillopora damicornis TaxID=46731 RepID=A0A3M6V5Q8_POCDA|nr:uncharacterized protein LOC113686245 [Pocillopora damicornis]RMX60918.1 hypothetical protein pdam_00003434 [Pocillopora damicornis]